MSALDDATSLDNGTLIMTPLKGVDGVEYVVAQGAVSVGRLSFLRVGGGGGRHAPPRPRRTIRPSAASPTGPMVVREARGKVLCGGRLKLLIREPDYNTARAIAKKINESSPAPPTPSMPAPSTSSCPANAAPTWFPSSATSACSRSLPIRPARVVINERTGTIVAGHNVKIATVAVTHGNLAIVTSNEPIVSQPESVLPGQDDGAAAGPARRHGTGTFDARPRRNHDRGRSGPGAQRPGAAPRDLIVIFQALKRLGALHAELVFM